MFDLSARTLATALLLLVALAACQRRELPPIDGAFVFSDGQDAAFHNGQFVGTAFGRGTYAVDGTHVTVRMESGARLEGERLDETHLQLTTKDGQRVPPIDLYRAGSADALEGKRTLATRLGRPVPTSAQRDAQAAAQAQAMAASAFTPDPNTPLERYAPLDRHEDLDLVRVAYAVPALSDDQVLAALMPGYADQADAFKKKDMAAGLPALRERIEQVRQQHYFSVPVRTQPTDRSGAYIQAAFGPYDLSAKAFPIVHLAHCFDSVSNFAVRITSVAFTCALPVADENLARKIEAQRAGNIYVGLEGRVYLAITAGAPPGHAVPVTILHAHLAVSEVAPDLRAEQDL